MCGHVAPSLPGIDPRGRACSLVSFQGKAFAHFLTRQCGSASPATPVHKTPKLPVRAPVWLLHTARVLDVYPEILFSFRCLLCGSCGCCLNAGIFRTLMN